MIPNIKLLVSLRQSQPEIKNVIWFELNKDTPLDEELGEFINNNFVFQIQKQPNGMYIGKNRDNFNLYKIETGEKEFDNIFIFLDDEWMYFVSMGNMGSKEGEMI